MKLTGGNNISYPLETVCMGLGKDVLNGSISLIISVAVTVAMADDDHELYDLTDVVLAVAISGFLSGFFTSYFADDS